MRALQMFELSEKFVAGKDGADLDIMDNPLERKFVREGKIRKNGNERMIFLFTDILVLTKESVKRGESLYEVRRVIPLEAALLRTQRHPVKPKERLGFEITVPDAGSKRYTADFMALSEEDRDSWLRDLKAQVMALVERTEMRGEDSPHGRTESLCVYGSHHKLLGGTLAHAALAGDAETVRRVRDEAPEEFGSLVAEQDEYGASVLHIAAFSGEVDVLREILQAESVKPLLRRLGAERDRDGLTLSCHVARQGHTHTIALLAEASDVMDGLHVVHSGDGEAPVIDLNQPDAHGVTPLEHAVQNQQSDAAFALLDHRVRVDGKGPAGLTGLMRACAAGRISDVRRWLELGASVDEVCDAGHSALHHAACGATLQRQCVAALLMAGAKPNLKCADGRTALAIAEESGNTAAAESLVERGAHSEDARYARQKEKWAAAKVDDEDKQPTRRNEPEAQWMLDDASEHCTLCGSDFGFINRRHHCRSCGTLACYYCTTHRYTPSSAMTCGFSLAGAARSDVRLCVCATAQRPAGYHRDGGWTRAG
jgi:ankyrin repeat protein